MPATTTARTAQVRRFTPTELEAELLRAAPLVVDLRAPEVRAAGHIAASLPLAAHQVGDWVASTSDDASQRARRTIVLCDDGRRSLGVAQRLAAAGFRDVGILRGGFPAWQEANLPVARTAARHQRRR